MVEGMAATPYLTEELAIEDEAVQTTAVEQPRVRGRGHIVEARRV